MFTKDSGVAWAQPELKRVVGLHSSGGGIWRSRWSCVEDPFWQAVPSALLTAFLIKMLENERLTLKKKKEKSNNRRTCGFFCSSWLTATFPFEWCNCPKATGLKQKKQQSYWCEGERGRAEDDLQPEASVNICMKCHRHRQPHAPHTHTHTLPPLTHTQSLTEAVTTGKENSLIEIHQPSTGNLTNVALVPGSDLSVWHTWYDPLSQHSV